MPRYDGIEDDVGSMSDSEGPRADPHGPAIPHAPTGRRTGLRSAAMIAIGAIAITGLGAYVVASRPASTATPSGDGQSPSTSDTARPSADDPTPTATGSGPSATVFETRFRGYLAERSDLIERAALARTGVQPYAAALDDLVVWARGAVRRDPRPAVRLRIRGTEGPFVDDTATAYGLALAHVMTGERRYGEAAARFIMAWVDTTTSTRGTCKNDGACQTSLIISRTVPGFVFAADLLQGSDVFDDASRERLRIWLQDVMLPTASELDNNWGDAGTFTRIALTTYLGDQAGFDSAIQKWHELLDLVKPDGHIPAEVARGRGGIGYTQEALDYKVAAAMIAERRGVDLWDYAGSGGGSLKGALDYLATYMAHPSRWPWYDGVRRWPPSAVWELAYSHWHDPAYAALVLEGRPYGSDGHSAVRWTTLTNGIPIDAS
jgi:Alginate lyase